MTAAPASASGDRATFASRTGGLLTMIGVAVGLGNVWRFPYMVGTFGGAPFVLAYIGAVVLLGVPVLLAELSLGRSTRRGPVGAYMAAGMPGGRLLGWGFFAVVAAASAYYTNALGWVLFHALAQATSLAGLGDPGVAPAAILPPQEGIDLTSLGLQTACSATVIAACVVILLRGLRRGIERASRILMPVLLVCILLLVVRSLTLPGAWAGVHWYILKFDLAAMTPGVLMAALGQAFFSLSLGGTFMVVYGSYTASDTPLRPQALGTAFGDLLAGLLAGLAILPAVIALGLKPDSGPALLFETLPRVFATIPGGAIFGLIFYAGLLGAAYLSILGALEVLVVGLTDNTNLSRRQAILAVAILVFLLAFPSMINMRIFVPWDLTFGSGMQTLGGLIAVVAVGWFLPRKTVMEQLGADASPRGIAMLYAWLRYVVPLVILLLAAWWLRTDVLPFFGF